MEPPAGALCAPTLRKVGGVEAQRWMAKNRTLKRPCSRGTIAIAVTWSESS